MKKWLLALVFVSGFARESEVLDLDVIPYEALIQNDPKAIETLQKALFEKGIVGMSGAPGFSEKLSAFVQKSREFSALPEQIKGSYAPNYDLGEKFLGYEKGKEKFKRPDGKWVVDDHKNSYYAFVPDTLENKWPEEVDLQSAFQDLGMLMAEMAKLVMEKIDLLGPKVGIYLNETSQVGRMLYYQKSLDTHIDNPLWCGAHYDHGLFTAITPGSYFIDSNQVAEPNDTGLFIRIGNEFKKVEADLEVLMFQVGEFGQLLTNDAIKATEHRVQKPTQAQIERYAMALFISAPMDTLIHSVSELTQDTRYGGKKGDPCTFQH